MNNDKIIRAISDIDDRYILEAAPDQPAMANRRRFLAGRVIGITAIAAAAVIGLLIGANDALYGLSQRGGTTFLVTSGISGWAIPIKTGTFSEFVVIDLSSTASEA